MHTRALLALAAAAFLAPAGGVTQDAKSVDPPLTDDEKILQVLNRFTSGATPGLVAEVKKQGLMEWFDKQLKGDLPETEAYKAAVKDFETLPLAIEVIYTKYNGRYAKDATQEERTAAVARHTKATKEHLQWIVARSLYSSNMVRETSADFFRNHFSVSTDKTHVFWMVIAWEREVIYANALTSFGDLLEATAKGAAMLFFLDNSVSRRPYSEEELKSIGNFTRRTTGSDEQAEVAMEAARQVGPNENYARELMELHTLGVDNGYTQQDVIEVAKCFTGWTLSKNFAGKFSFDEDIHVAGPKKVLGHDIEAGGDHDASDGQKVLEILKKHPNTAHFLAWKLCRYYVNDDPDPAMVDRVAKLFHETGGDLQKVYRAIVNDPQFFTRRNYLAKFKRPWEFVISALRATNVELRNFVGLERTLDKMNEPLYRCQDPTGFYDQAEAWRDPGAMATRWTVATELAQGKLAGAKIPDSFYSDLPADKPREWKDILARKILPVAGLAPRTSANVDRLIERALEKNPKATPKELGPVIVAILLGSPEFQKQ